MRTIDSLLKSADPLRHEPELPADRIGSARRTVTAAASSAPHPIATRRRKFVRLATAAVLIFGVLSFGSRVWPRMGFETYAAVRFEVRLAETVPAPGLREMKLDTGRSIYLHHEVLVSNSDIASAEIATGADASKFNVNVRFTAQGAVKMRAATATHIGKPIAILIDDALVMAPIVRAQISESAVINGDYSKDQAERVVNGIVEP